MEKWLGDVRVAIQQTLELVRARAEGQCVQMRCDLADRPLMIEADHEQLRHLFLNLLGNALDTLPQGGNIRITAVEAEPASPKRRAAGQMQVRPCRASPSRSRIMGPVFLKDLGNRIFEPYVSTKDTGMGLGLAICRRIVHSHGGEISASNAAEGGAVFTVRLRNRRKPFTRSDDQWSRGRCPPELPR